MKLDGDASGRLLCDNLRNQIVFIIALLTIAYILGLRVRMFVVLDLLLINERKLLLGEVNR